MAAKRKHRKWWFLAAGITAVAFSVCYQLWSRVQLDAHFVGRMPTGFKFLPRSQVYGKPFIDTRLFGRRLIYPVKTNVPKEFEELTNYGGFLKGRGPGTKDMLVAASWTDERGVSYWPEPDGYLHPTYGAEFVPIPLAYGNEARTVSVWGRFENSPSAPPSQFKFILPGSGAMPPMPRAVNARTGIYTLKISPEQPLAPGFQATLKVEVTGGRAGDVYFVFIQNRNAAETFTTRCSANKPGFISVESGRDVEAEAWIQLMRPRPLSLVVKRRSWRSYERPIEFSDETGNLLARCTEYDNGRLYGGRVLDDRFRCIELDAGVLGPGFPSNGDPSLYWTGSLDDLPKVRHGQTLNAIGWEVDSTSYARINLPIPEFVPSPENPS